MSNAPKVGSAASYRARKKKRAQGVPVELPSGEVWVLRRIPLDVWMMMGKLPDSLTRAGLKAWKGTDDGRLALTEKEMGEQVASELGDEEAGKLFVFMREVVREVCVSPRIVENADPLSDEEIAPEEVDEEDFMFLYEYGLSQAPEQPVNLAGGEVSVSALEKFPRRRRRAPAAAGEGGREVRDEAVAVAGDS